MPSKFLGDANRQRQIMKIKVEIPDSTFRSAKSKAAERGITLRQFFTEAIEDKLRACSAPQHKPWIEHLGKLKHLRKETKRIERLIHQHAEKIDMGMWR